MNKRTKSTLFVLNCVILCIVLTVSVIGSRIVTVLSENATPSRKHCVIIDAGHGGVDGGATSCTGILESAINLEIALRLDDMLHLLGIETLMIRTTDISIYTEGTSIAAKKVSDLKNRVKLTNETENAIVVSIHQNQFTDSRYSGAQVFYAPTTHSETLAKSLQSAFVRTLNPDSNRQAKKATGIYLLQHIQCPGILVECGFLSNPEEEAKLRNPVYQKKLCSVIASVLSRNMNHDLIA